MNNGLADAFKKRYNRTVIVWFIVDTNRVETHIKYRDTEFILEEHTKDGLTEYVDVSYGSKKQRFSRYIDAEIYVADMIGEM